MNKQLFMGLLFARESEDHVQQLFLMGSTGGANEPVIPTTGIKEVE